MIDDLDLFFCLAALFFLAVFTFFAIGPITGEGWPGGTALFTLTAAFSVTLFIGAIISAARTETEGTLFGFVIVAVIWSVIILAFGITNRPYINDQLNKNYGTEQVLISNVTRSGEVLSLELEGGKELKLPDGYFEQQKQKVYAGDFLEIKHARMDFLNCDVYTYDIASDEKDKKTKATEDVSKTENTSSTPSEAIEPDDSAGTSTSSDNSSLRNIFTAGGNDHVQ